jgi:hypothetical protein
MDIKNKYGFNFNWFLESYSKMNFPKKAYNIDDKTQEFIDNIYDTHYLNYDAFLDEVLPILNQIDKKQEYLKPVRNCLKCKLYYPYSMDSFIFIKLKTKNNELNDITHKLCFNCIRNLKILNCKKCYNMDFEPYEIVYLDNIEEQFICKTCYS